MRKDFAKLLVERERRGSRVLSYRDIRHEEKNLQLDLDGESQASNKRSMVVYLCRKEFSENLNPLYKWLLKNVNQPWDKVYSELRAAFSPSSTINNHIYQHLGFIVELNPAINDEGEVCDPHYLRPLSSGGMRGSFYVDANGLLKKAPIFPTSQFTAKKEYIGLDETTALVKISGLWYFVRITERKFLYNKTYIGFSGKFTWIDKIYESYELGLNPKTIAGWPSNVRALNKKQLSSKELKKYGLKN